MTNANETPPLVDPAHETAGILILDAMAAIPNLAPAREVHMAEALLILAHALVAKLDAIETSQLAAHRELMNVLAPRLREISDHGLNSRGR